jgi:hypothetical protein
VKSEIVVACLGLCAFGAVEQPPDVSTRAVVERAAGYVKDYQQRLTSVIADEVYTQDVVEQVPRDPKMPISRTLQSEVFFMFANANWLAIRDVAAVDGETIPNRRDLLAALRTLPAREVAQAFKESNARFNLGRTFRNFNEPTLSLLVLDDLHRERFSFDRTRVEQADGVTLVTMSYTEKESPTLIRDLKHGRVFSRGELLVEAATGRIRRATLAARIQDTKVRFETDYKPDERLGAWVPSHFREQYEYGVRTSDALSSDRSDYELIRCDAKYTNYRRFQTTVRIR